MSPMQLLLQLSMVRLCEFLFGNILKLAIILNFLYLAYFLYRHLFNLVKCQLDVLEVLWQEKMPDLFTNKLSDVDYTSAGDVTRESWGEESATKSAYDSEEEECQVLLPEIKLKKRRSCVKCGKKVKLPRRNQSY